ncbi:MAG: MauE/DoxX family redox-associated membrane protein [Candidatus Dormiibacterota bacterium]
MIASSMLVGSTHSFIFANSDRVTNWELSTLLVLVARFTLAAVLVAASAAKLSHLSAFRETVGSLGVHLPGYLLGPAAAAIAGTEGLLGLLSASLIGAPVVDKLVLLVFVVFLVAAAYAAKFRPAASCRCFGSLTESNFDARTVARNSLLVAIAVVPFLITPATTSFETNLTTASAFAILGVLVAFVSFSLRSDGPPTVAVGDREVDL